MLFASEGANVVLVDRKLESILSVMRMISEKSPNVRSIAVGADVGIEEEIKGAVDAAVGEFGRLDIMVCILSLGATPLGDVCVCLTLRQFNNAGIMDPKDDNALNTEEKIWDLTMQINVKGVWWGSKYAILAMRKNKADEERGLTAGGSVINTASFVAIMGAATPQLACTRIAVFRLWVMG